MELIVVIAIIAILVLLATPKLRTYIERTQLTRIQHDIKVAEVVLDDYLIQHNNFPNSWPKIPTGKLSELANLGQLYNVEGVVDTMPDGDYKEVDKQFLKDKIKTKLGGKFYTSEIGRVYYEDDKPSDIKENLFDREVEIDKQDETKIKVLDYNFPNGIFTPGDLIEGDITVEGIQAGTYTLHADINHSKINETLQDSSTFSLGAGEVKTISFKHRVTSEDRIGFYDLNVNINEGLEELIKYHIPQSIYIAQSEWEYFYEDDFYRVHFNQIGGIGSLNPENTSYEYVYEEDTGIDYSSVMFDINPDDNRTGQVATILPVTYGTYEALIKVPDNDALLNGFFLYGTDKYDSNLTYEVDMEILIYEGKWQLWTTIFNESHNEYDYNGEEPGVIFQEIIDLDFDPSESFHSYRIDFYKDFISFTLDGVEVSRWNNSFQYGDMHMHTGTFYTHWLTGELSTTKQEMNVQWMRRGYFPHGH